MGIVICQGFKEIANQFKGLPSTVYVNSHLLKATLIANKIISSGGERFDYFFILMFDDKEALDTIDRSIEFLQVIKQQKDGGLWDINRSKLYDLEKYGKVSSDLKRRSLTRKGSKRFFDVILCYWFFHNKEFLPFKAGLTPDGRSVWELDLDNSSSPENYTICFKVEGHLYALHLRGSGSKRRKHLNRKTGRTSNKAVAAEVVQTGNNQGSKSTSTPGRYWRAVQSQASNSSVRPISSGPSCPGE